MTRKNLIIHIMEGNAEALKEKLHEFGPFEEHFDGWECTVSVTEGKLSTRYYYYGIESCNTKNEKLNGMLRHLCMVGRDHKYLIKILEGGCGNHNFD